MCVINAEISSCTDLSMYRAVSFSLFLFPFLPVQYLYDGFEEFLIKAFLVDIVMLGTNENHLIFRSCSTDMN